VLVGKFDNLKEGGAAVAKSTGRPRRSRRAWRLNGKSGTEPLT